MMRLANPRSRQVGASRAVDCRQKSVAIGVCRFAERRICREPTPDNRHPGCGMRCPFGSALPTICPGDDLRRVFTRGGRRTAIASGLRPALDE